MTAATVGQLCQDLLNAGVGFSVSPNTSKANDWIVTVQVPVGVQVDAKQVAALETKFGIGSPVTNGVVFT